MARRRIFNPVGQMQAGRDGLEKWITLTFKSILMLLLRCANGLHSKASV